MAEVEGANAPLCVLDGIVKRFGDLTANDHISLSLRAGEIHALLGENGAGKSTLVKILDGLLAPDEGRILWQGRPITLASPEDAATLGIGMVFQHFSLFDNLTVAENIAVAMPGGVGLRVLNKRIMELGERYGLALDPKREVWTLSAGERQRIEIVRALLREPKLLILDEPTSVLTPQEADTLFATLEELARQGCALLYISHKLEEVTRLCDRATILRGGRVVAMCNPREETPQKIASLMVGTAIPPLHDRDNRPADVRLSLRRLNAAPADLHGIALKDVSLDVRGGEILGLAGVAGNGQSELFEILSGERAAPQRGMVLIDGEECGLDGIDTRRRKGAAFLPEERNGHAAVGALSLPNNVVLSRHATSDIAPRNVIAFDRARALSDAIIAKFDVRTPSPLAEAGKLSGGNLQKFVVGREIIGNPRVLVIDNPTWGVDAGAAVLIRQALIDLAAAGTAVLMISQDLDEIFAIADRIAVIHHGAVTAPRNVRTVAREEIGLMMTGGQGASHAA